MSACLCIQLVYVLINLFVLVLHFFLFTSYVMVVHLYVHVCVSVNLMHAPIILHF